MEQGDVNKGSWLQRVPTEVPIRVQTMLIATVALVLCGAVTVFGSAYAINRMKNLLVEEALEEAQRTANAACEQILDVVRRSGADSMAEIVNHPEVRRELDILSSEGAITVAAVLDEDGRVIYQKFCRDTMPAGIQQVDLNNVLTEDILKSSVVADSFDVQGYAEAIKPMNFPIVADGRTVGHIQIGLASSPTLGRIDFLSRQISSSLLVMVLVVFAIMLLSIVLVYYAFRRQIELIQTATRSENLANMGALASGLAHEIRNPLHAMNLHLEVVREDIESNDFCPEESARTINGVQRQIEHLNGIVTTFMNAASPVRMEFQEVSLHQLSKELLCFLRPDLEEAGIETEINVPEDATIQGDRVALHQVLLNLVINARQAMDKVQNRKLQISAIRDRRHWRLYIDDSGPGLPEGDTCFLFKTFFSKRAGGTGFGLSIARRIMEGHKGTIGACKSPLGGARFYLEFPAKAHVPAEPASV